MPTYKLTYFDFKGLGEGIRMILSYMDREFEDNRVEFPKDRNAEWFKIKAEKKFGKIPILEIDGEEVTQSTAICRYLAHEAGLLGSNPWENLQIDIIGGTVKDMTAGLIEVNRETNPVLKAEKMKVFKNEIVPFYFSIFDDIVKTKGGYLANGKLSWADFLFLGIAETAEGACGEPLFEKYTNLKALKDKVFAIPNVKKWIEKRPKTAL